MTRTFTVTLRDIDGEPMLDSNTMALLFGVPLADISALPFTNGHSLIPREWTRRGRQRASEARAHTGSADLLDSLAYWARKDHNADLVVVTE